MSNSRMRTQLIEHTAERVLARLGDDCLAELFEEHESQPAPFDFLIVGHQLEIPVPAHARSAHRQSSSFQERGHSICITPAHVSKPMRKLRSEHHSCRHCFSV